MKNGDVKMNENNEEKKNIIEIWYPISLCPNWGTWKKGNILNIVSDHCLFSFVTWGGVASYTRSFERFYLVCFMSNIIYTITVLCMLILKRLVLKLNWWVKIKQYECVIIIAYESPCMCIILYIPNLKKWKV